MAVFRAENQVLPRFAENMLKAETTRATLKAQERQLDQADERIKLDAENVVIRQQEADTRRESLDFQKQQAAEEQFAEWGYGIFTQYEQIYTTDPEGAGEFAVTTFEGLLENLPEGPGRDKLSEILKDGTITPEEMTGFRDQMLAMKDRFATKGGGGDDPLFGKPSIKDFTQKSVDAYENHFEATGQRDRSLLVPVETESSSKPTDLKSPLTVLKNEEIMDEVDIGFDRNYDKYKGKWPDSYVNSLGWDDYQDLDDLKAKHRQLSALIIANSPRVMAADAANYAFRLLIAEDEKGNPVPAPKTVMELNGSMYSLEPSADGMRWYSWDE